MVLLAAAGLKLAGLSAASLLLDNPLDGPLVRMAAIEWEAALGLWLLAGVAVRSAWLFTVGTFAAFAAVSAYLGLAGHASCNCLGVVKANPWGMVAFDLATVAALAATRPAGAWRAVTRRGVFAAAAVVAFGWGLFGTSGGADIQDKIRGALFGSHLTVAGGRVEFGTHPVGEIVTIEVAVRNAGGGPVTVLGGTNDCSLHTTGTPRTVPAYGSATIQVGLKVPDRASGRYARDIELWTDSAAKPKLRLAAVYEVP